MKTVISFLIKAPRFPQNTANSIEVMQLMV
jgi:hypothetical protein